MSVFQPKIFCLVGPSGVGKTTLLRFTIGALKLWNPTGVKVREVISTTTRQPRPGERDGVDYLFLNRDEADHYIKSGAYIEHVNYHGNTYGFLRADFESVLNEGYNVLCIVERHGLRCLIEEYGEDRVIGIKVLPSGRTPDQMIESIKSRLNGSGRAPEEIAARLKTVEDEFYQGGDSILFKGVVRSYHNAVGQSLEDLKFYLEEYGCDWG